MEWSAPLPEDMKQLIAALEEDIAQDVVEDDYCLDDFSDEFTNER